MLMVTAALCSTALEAAAEPAWRGYSPRILAPSFAQSEPRRFQKYKPAHPVPVRPHPRHASRIVAVPVLVPVYPDPYPLNGAPAEIIAAEASPYWYFCPDSQSYYPDVTACASGWRAYLAGTSRPAQ
jgi:hypothetical protein